MKKLVSYMKFAVIVSLCLGAIAWAAAEQRVDRYGGQFPLYLDKGLYVGPASPNPTNDTQNKVTRMLGGQVTFDFASQTITCNTTTLTVVGVQVNDPCFVGPPATGGAANSSFTCFVSAADVVTIKHCPAGTASDPASAIYEVRVISNT